MITATMDWNRLTMEVDGHAGYAEKGKDIVCAAASMLAGALGGVLEEAKSRGRCDMTSRDEDGHSVIRAAPRMGNVAEVKAYFRMAVTGFRMLQEQYPEHIRIREVD